MSKKLKIAIIIIVLLVVSLIICLCVFLGSVDWAKVVSDFLGRVWGNEY